MVRLALISAILILVGAIAPAYAKITTADCLNYKHTRVLRVSTTSGLDKAIRRSKAGDLIIMEPGHYRPSTESDGFHYLYFRNKHGTAARPITLCGSRMAIIDGGSSSGPYPMQIIGSKYINIIGITMKNGLKGLVIERSEHCQVSHVRIDNIGLEAVHIQESSHYNHISYSTITNTGRKDKGTGEGIYVGSSVNHRSSDICVGNRILYNTIGPGVTAEPIDIKENSKQGIIQGNVLDGRDLCGCNSAVSLINVKGNQYKVLNNVGRHAREDYFKVATTIGGQGRSNHFSGNKCLTKARSGYHCVFLPDDGGMGNSVACGQRSNSRCGRPKGL